MHIGSEGLEDLTDDDMEELAARFRGANTTR